MVDFNHTHNPDPALEEAQILLDYAEYSNQPIEDVIQKIGMFHDLNNPDFEKLGSNFYKESNNYIYDILGGNTSIDVRTNLINRFIPQGIKRIQDHPGTSFLDFGGGVGAVCEIVAKATNKDVHYVDIDSHSTNFAFWRLTKKHNLSIQFTIIPEDDFSLDQQYDIIFTDAVWEHLPPEKQERYLSKLISYIKPNGLFFFLVDLSGHTELMPMHFNVDIGKLHNIISHGGFECEGGRNTFASVWKKMAFTQIDYDAED